MIQHEATLGPDFSIKVGDEVRLISTMYTTEGPIVRGTMGKVTRRVGRDFEIEIAGGRRAVVFGTTVEKIGPDFERGMR